RPAYSHLQQARLHFRNQQGNGPIQVLAVDPRKEPSEYRYAEPFRLNDPREPGLRRVQLLEAMIVMDRQPEEAADPFPVAVRVELAHRERGLDAVAQVKEARRVWAEFPRRL